MIRVLYVTYWGLFLGGGETTFMNYYRHVNRSRVQFDFLIHDDGVANHYYEDEVKSLGAKVYRRTNPIRNVFKSFFALYKLLKSNPEIKVVHINGASTLLSSIDALCAKLAGISVIIIFSGSVMYYLEFRIEKIFRAMVRACATHYFAASIEAGVSMFGEKARDKIVISPCSRDLELFRFNQERRCKTREIMDLNNKTVIVNVGRLVEAKNQAFFLEVFAHALSKDSNLVLLIVGKGDLMSTLNEKAITLGIADKVHFLGKRDVTDDDLQDLLQASDIFVLPSHYEGLSGAAIEAQAAGLPCLLSNTVSPDTKVTDAVEFLPIDKGTDTWVERILFYRDFNRQDTVDTVRKAGYDIRDAARWLEDVYISAVEGEDINAK